MHILKFITAAAFLVGTAIAVAAPEILKLQDLEERVPGLEEPLIREFYLK